MNPYIQVFLKNGKKLLMKGNKDDVGDTLICGDDFCDFRVQISDMKKAKKEFSFSPKALGRIMAHSVSEETDSFVEKFLESKELPWLIESNELFFGETEESADEEMIEMFLDEAFGSDQNFIYRLTEKEDGLWVLSFVFNDEEVQSLPVKWEDLSC